MKLIGKYTNGNYIVSIWDDGTKIKETDDDEFIAAFPESMDCKITNYCDMGCPYCHEDSTIDGQHGDILNAKFIDTLRPYTEIAIGGGNPLAHPNIALFLQKLKERKVIANITVNEIHFMKNLPLLRRLRDEKMIWGLGISYSGKMNIDPHENDHPFILAVKEFPNAVIHIINGMHNLNNLRAIAYKDLNLLILGYKDFRRGKDYHNDNVDNRKELLSTTIMGIMKQKWFKVVSFDNLALKQLDIQSKITPEQWERFYQGDDGSHTLYVDMVKQQFARSSTAIQRYEILDTIDEIFDIIKNEKVS